MLCCGDTTAGTLVAERLLYLPSAGFCVLMAHVFVKAGSRSKLAGFVVNVRHTCRLASMTTSAV